MKKVLIGIVGQYRTFERTYHNIFKNVVENNNDYEFDIILNTDFNNMNINTTINKGLEIKNYDKDELIPRLNECYGKRLKHIMNYEVKDPNMTGSMIFRKRIQMICDSDKDEYDLYVFLRFDVIFEKPLELNLYMSDSFNVICGNNVNDNRQEHHRDWDFCFIFTKIKYFHYFLGKYSKDNGEKLNKDICPLKMKEILEHSNIKSSFIDRFVLDSSIVKPWVKNFWCLICNMQIHGVCVNFDTENFTKLIR